MGNIEDLIKKQQDAYGKIIDLRNRAQRRNNRQRHKIYTKKYPSYRSYIRSVIYIKGKSDG